MGVFGRLSNLIGFGEKKAEDALDDNFGAQIAEGGIHKSKKALQEAKQTVIQQESELRVLDQEIKSDEGKLNAMLSKIQKLKEKHDSTEDPAEKEALFNAAKNLKVEANKLTEDLASKKEVYEVTKATVDQAKSVIENRIDDVEDAERNLAKTKMRQETIKANKKVNAAVGGLNGDESLGQGYLDKINRKQDVEFEQMKLQSEQRNKKSALDAADDLLADGDADNPW